MTLKNSSWKAEKSHRRTSSPDILSQMKENGKRRLWLFALLSFVMLLCYPMITALTMSRYTKEGATLDRWLGLGHSMLGIGGGPTVFLVTIGAVLCTVEGFSWIYSRKKIDMYMSQPITAGRRFFMTYINGILIYFVPYLLSVLLTLLIIAGTGRVSAGLFVNVLFTVPAALIYFLAIYNLTLIAMMLSGRRGMGGFFILLFFLYEPVLRATLENYAVTYFTTYVSRDTMEHFINPVFHMIETLDKSIFYAEAGKATAADIAQKLILPMMPGMLLLFLEAAVFGIIAYYCYKKRPMEAASRAVAFSSVRGPLKVLLMLITGLLGSACFRSVAGSDGFFIGFSGLLLGILFCQVFMEIVFESDLKAFARHKKSFAAGILVTLAVCFFYTFDIGGYDTWVPEAGQVEGAALEIEFDNIYRFEYVDEENRVDWRRRQVLEIMEMTDVSGVLSLAKDGMGKDAQEQNPDTQLRCNVKYKMKNGKEKYRSFYIDYVKEKTVLDILFANQEYKEGIHQELSAQMDEIFERSEIYYSNGMQETEVVDKNALALMRAYQADVRDMSFSDVMDTVPCGLLELRYKTEDLEEYWLPYPVFPGYTRTVEYLRGKNIELYLYVKPSAVEKITVRCYQEPEDKEVITNVGFFSMSGAQKAAELTEAEYDTRAEINEIIGCLYPSSLVGWSYITDSFDEDITVIMEGADNPEAYIYHWNDTDFMVKNDELPEFVKKDVGRE